MLTREEIIAVITERMRFSAPAAQHTHIECNCPGLVHQVGEYKTKYWEGCYCQGCASKEAVKRGLAATDTQPEVERPDDRPQWCEDCGALITSDITPTGALEELDEHWLGSFPELESAHLRTPDRWREFLLCAEAIAEEHLPRLEALLWSRPSPVSIERIAALVGAELVRRGLSVAVGPRGHCMMAVDDVVLQWDRTNATVTIDAGTMFDRVLTLPMAERVLAKLTASWAVARRTRYWLLDALEEECMATTGHPLGLRGHAFHPWKDATNVL